MMDGVIFPEAATVKHAVQPIQHEIRRDQEQHGLQPQWQLGQGTMAVVVKGNQFVGVMYFEDDAGPAHEHPDPKYAREQRNEEPLTHAAADPPLPPPPATGSTRPHNSPHRHPPTP